MLHKLTLITKCDYVILNDTINEQMITNYWVRVC